MSALRYSLSTACLAPQSLLRVADAAAEAGYVGVELVLGPELLVRGMAWCRRLAQAAPLPVMSVHQPIYPVGRWAHPLSLMHDTVSLAIDLGAEAVVLHSPWSPSWDAPSAQAWLRALSQAQALTLGTTTLLTIENLGAHRGMPARTVLGSLDDLAQFCRQRGLGLTYDTSHAGTNSADMPAELASIGDVLANVHFSDCRPHSRLRQVPFFDLAAANHQMPGEGVLDLAAALTALVRQGYAAPVTFEVSPFALRAWQPRRRRERLRQALTYARTAVDQAQSMYTLAPSTVISVHK